MSGGPTGTGRNIQDTEKTRESLRDGSHLGGALVSAPRQLPGWVSATYLKTEEACAGPLYGFWRNLAPGTGKKFL